MSQSMLPESSLTKVMLGSTVVPRNNGALERVKLPA